MAEWLKAPICMLCTNYYMSNNSNIRYNWLCEDCNKTFNTRSLLYIHYKECNLHQQKLAKKLNKTWQCKYCNGIFKTERLLNSHKKICDKRPKKNNFWQCSICNEVFSSRRKLYEHKKLTQHKIGYANDRVSLLCPFCNRALTTKPSYKNHTRCCIKNPNRVLGFARKWTDEEKKNASDRMKLLHKEGKAFSWADLSRRKEPSYPEKWLIRVLENEFGLIEEKDYEREKKFYTFSLDFVFPNKKVIEIDGSQHKRSDYQKDCDKRKDQKLKEEGWLELRLDWSYCYNNSKEAIQKIKEFLG